MMATMQAPPPRGRGRGRGSLSYLSLQQSQDTIPFSTPSIDSSVSPHTDKSGKLVNLQYLYKTDLECEGCCRLIFLIACSNLR